jgi:uncharacterized RDD family membrane protein YckC
METPEGIFLDLRIAGPVVRGLAWSVDFGVRFAVFMILIQALAWAGNTGWGLISISIFLLEWFYPVLFEVLRGGVTPGKQIFGIKVLMDDGTPIGWQASILRNLLRAVDFLPLFNVTGLITMVMTKNFQRLGDIAAGTLTVYESTRGSVGDLPAAPAVQPGCTLTVDEQTALVHFSERMQGINSQRSEELADLAAPLTGVTGKQGVEAIVQMANWIAGRR